MECIQYPLWQDATEDNDVIDLDSELSLATSDSLVQVPVVQLVSSIWLCR